MLTPWDAVFWCDLPAVAVLASLKVVSSWNTAKRDLLGTRMPAFDSSMATLTEAPVGAMWSFWSGLKDAMALLGTNDALS